MSPEFPPQPSKRATVALAAVALVTFLYSIIIAGQILLWFILVGIAVGLYLTYLLIVAVFRLVEAVERIADAREAEVDGRDRTGEADANRTGEADANRTLGADADRTDGNDEGSERTGRDASEAGD